MRRYKTDTSGWVSGRQARWVLAAAFLAAVLVTWWAGIVAGLLAFALVIAVALGAAWAREYRREAARRAVLARMAERAAHPAGRRPPPGRHRPENTAGPW